MAETTHLNVQEVLPPDDPEVVDLDILQPEDPDPRGREVEVVEVALEVDAVHVDCVAGGAVGAPERREQVLEFAARTRKRK